MFMRRLYLFAPDEVTEAPADADTAIEAPGGETTTQEEVNWQKRAEDAQAWGTQNAQEAAELRRYKESLQTDDEALRELLAARGYELPDDTPETPADLDELKQQLLAEIRQEIEPVKQTQAQIAQANELAAAEAHAAKVFADEGVDESWHDAVIGMALTLPADKDGMPPFAEAHKALRALVDADLAKAATKRRPTHQFTPGGVAGDDKPDLSTSAGRVANAMAKLADTA